VVTPEYVVASGQQVFINTEILEAGKALALVVPKAWTALGLLQDFAPIKLFNSSGGGWSFLVQLARSARRKVNGTASTPEKLEIVSEAGCR